MDYKYTSTDRKPRDFHMEKKITINDVATAAQVSSGTVHRALYDKPGVSEAVRKKIVRIANEMGYQPNLVASSLKKKPLRIVVAFPGPTQDNRYFYGELWNGYRQYRKELIAYNLDIIEAPCYNDEVNSFADNLKSIMRQYQGEIDGVIGGGKLLEKDQQTACRLTENGIPLVLVSEEVEGVDCLCSVQSEHRTDGRMAAELLTAQIPEDSSILICAGDVLLPSNIENTMGFESYLREQDAHNKLIKVYGYRGIDNVYERVLDTLRADETIKGLYSVNARCSLFLARAVEEAGLVGKVRIIGSDLYPESIRYMEKGIINLIIDKNPRNQAIVGLKRLLNYLIRREEPLEKEENVVSTIICRSNMDKYVQGKFTVS